MNTHISEMPRRVLLGDSSNIVAIGYDRTNQICRIQFKGGSTYEYTGVTRQDFGDLVAAESIGSYFAKIFKDAHPCKKVATDAASEDTANGN